MIILVFISFIQESLVRVAVWCIGEYGDMLVNNVGMLDVEDPITVSACFSGPRYMILLSVFIFNFVSGKFFFIIRIATYCGV